MLIRIYLKAGKTIEQKMDFFHYSAGEINYKLSDTKGNRKFSLSEISGIDIYRTCNSCNIELILCSCGHYYCYNPNCDDYSAMPDHEYCE